MISPVEMFKGGGGWMYAITAVAIFAAAIGFERLFFVYFRASINSTAFMSTIQKFIMANNIDRAVKACNAAGEHAVLPRVVKAGLTRAHRAPDEITNAIEEATLEVAPTVNKRTPFLAMLANVATLTGLLGTIAGLILAFKAVAKASAETKQAMLAQGISVAMFTTMGGLIVAIPTLVLHSIIVNKSNSVLDDVDQYGLKTANLLIARQQGGSEEA
jgi:biopolymer transport protein ExbB